MSDIKVRSLLHVRYAAPDLRRMRAFLLDFGMQDAAPSHDGALRMRGSGEAPFIHETIEGEPKFLGLALEANGVGDLERLAARTGAMVRDYDKPGGGKVVTLIDPNGFQIDVVAGYARLTPSATGGDAWNTAAHHVRVDAAKQVASRPSQVVRLGHVVLRANNMAGSHAWWRDRFGMLISDKVLAPNGDFEIAFMRCDRGDEPVDHHSVCLGATEGAPDIHHCAYEVADMDDLMAGKDYLTRAGHSHRWGVGRHYLGGQVFDYWSDPWGNYIEHWTDGDLYTADVPMKVADLETALGVQWGPATPPKDF